MASPSGAASSSIFRTATSRYTTYEQSTLEDLKCQICLTTLKNCVALEPCGHNFCATCLSHHLGNQLQSGLQLSCPFRWDWGRLPILAARWSLTASAASKAVCCTYHGVPLGCSACQSLRHNQVQHSHRSMGINSTTAKQPCQPYHMSYRCPPPDRIVINYAVRGLIGLLSSSGRPLSSHHSRQAASGIPGLSGGRQSMSRSGSRGLQTAFGQAAGSTSSLPSLAAAAQAAAASVGAQLNHVDQQQQQQQIGSGAGVAAAAARQGSAPLANGGSSLLVPAASSASASSFDTAAGSAATAGTSGLPGVAEGGSTQAPNPASGGNYRTGRHSGAQRLAAAGDDQAAKLRRPPQVDWHMDACNASSTTDLQACMGDVV